MSSLRQGAIFFTLAGVMASILTLSIVSRRQKAGKEEKRTTNNRKPSKSTPAFPWEPEGQHQQQEIPEKGELAKDFEAYQLELLASMTFANGGLRAPVCQCCL